MTIRNLIDELRAQGEVFGYDAEVEITGIEKPLVVAGSRTLKIISDGESAADKARKQMLDDAKNAQELIDGIVEALKE